MLLTLGMFFVAFVLLWVGSGMAVAQVSSIAHRLRMSPFFISFFLLGFFTSITEIMVGINAYLNDEPEIFVGNLIGSSAVVFLLVIPLLAVLGNGVKINHKLDVRDLLIAVLVVGIPALMTLDNKITLVDALVCVFLYCILAYRAYKKSDPKEHTLIINLTQGTLYMSLFKLVLAVFIVFLGSHYLVEETKSLGELLGISSYVISILIVAIGTNVPELTIAIRAIIAKKKDIAFGDFLGSAALNTLELGILSIISVRPILANGSNFSVLAIATGMVLFGIFGRSQRTITRVEGVAILMVYLMFVVLELVTGPGWNL